MTNDFQMYIGGRSGKDDATDYSGQVTRASYDKVFCDTGRFDVTLAGVDRSSDDSNIAFNQAVFFLINDGTNDWCLFKGVIKNVRWTMKYMCRISGTQSRRVSDGGAGDLGSLKAPQGTKQTALTTKDLITDTVWFSGSQLWKDDGSDGEGNEVREW